MVCRMFLRWCPRNQQLLKGREGRRTRQRDQLHCDVGMFRTQVWQLAARKLTFKRQVLVAKENLLYSGGQQPGEKVDSCPKAYSPLLIRRQELLKGSFRGALRRWGATCRAARSAPTVILKLVMRWSDQHHLDCSKCNEPSIPELFYSHLLEASSRNCVRRSSLHHDYSLVIM